MEWLLLIVLILFFSSKSFRAGLGSGVKRRRKRNHYSTKHKSINSVKHKPTKGAHYGGRTNNWQKKKRNNLKAASRFSDKGKD
jgi:hypothetical protein